MEIFYWIGGIVAVGSACLSDGGAFETGGILMTANDILQIVLYFGVLLLLAKPLGLYMARVYENQPFVLDRVLGPVERIFYRICGIRPDEEMDWKKYTLAVLLFNMAGLLVVYLLQRMQGILPLNPQEFPGRFA